MTGLERLRTSAHRGEQGPHVGAWSAVVSVVALAVAGTVGLALKQPWLFPSLGPTLMVLAETPQEPVAHVRAALVGHAVGIGAGWLALAVTGLRAHPAVLVEGLSAARIVAACLSVAVTALVLQALRSAHPPAGATTLIVSLGLLRTAPQLLTLALAVLLCTAVAVLLNLAVGMRQQGVRRT